MNRQSEWVLGFFLAACAVDGVALDTTLSLGAGVDHTDNSLKSLNKMSELERSVDAVLTATHRGSDITTDVDYTVTRIDFDKDTQSDETTTEGDASISYEQIKKTLIWTLSNSQRNIVRDKQFADTQDNRDQRSATQLQSTFIMRPSTVDSISTSLSYTDIQYDDSSQRDSDSIGADIAWDRTLSATDNLLMNLAYSDIDFGNQLDYKYYSAAVGYQVTLARLNYRLLLGYNEQDRDGDNNNGGLLDAVFNYSYGGSSWSLSLLQELTDTSQDSDDSGLSELDQFGASDVADSLERTSAEFTYSNTILCGVCGFSLSLLGEQERFDSFDNDSDEVAVSSSFSYQLSRLTRASADVEYRQFTFKGNNTRTNYDIIVYGLNMSRLLTKDLSVSLRFAYEERSSDSPAEDYDELSGGISLTYQLL